jgi:hypothetical protein
MYTQKKYFYLLAYDTLDLDNRKGRGAQAEQIDLTRQAFEQRSIASFSSPKLCGTAAKISKFVYTCLVEFKWDIPFRYTLDVDSMFKIIYAIH